jgi:hypothetical protein
MKGFDRGHMVVCLSEVAGSAGGVEVVADAVTKLYRRMAKTWPTEDVVDDTVRATASKVRTSPPNSARPSRPPSARTSANCA